MKPVDEVVAEILHANGQTPVYDAAKRREYYLKTRELKGRRRGTVHTPVRPPARGSNLPAPRKKMAPQAKTTVQRIAELKVRLEKLKTLLQKLGEEAKARSGVESKSDRSSTSSSSKSSGSATAKEKREAKEYYEKHKKEEKKETPAQEEKALQQKIERVREQIKEMREKLAEARKPASKRQQTTR